MHYDDLAPLRASLNEAAKAILALRATMDQREARMSASFAQEMQALHREVGDVRHEVAAIVGGASSQITREAKDAVAPVAAQYDRVMAATSARLQGANKDGLDVVWNSQHDSAARAPRRLDRDGLLPPGTGRRQGRAPTL